VTPHRFLGSDDHPGGATVICELLPGVTLPYLRSKNGLSFARFSIDEIAPHAVVEREGRAVGVVQRLDFAAAGRKPSLFLRNVPPAGDYGRKMHPSAPA